MNIDIMLDKLLAGRIVEATEEAPILLGDILIDLILEADKMADFILKIEKFERDYSVDCETVLTQMLDSGRQDSNPIVYPVLDKLLSKVKPSKEAEESLL